MMSKAILERELAKMRDRQMFGDKRKHEAYENRKAAAMRAREAAYEATRGKPKPDLVKCKCGECRVCRQRIRRRLVVQNILSTAKRESYLQSRGSAYDQHDFHAPGITSRRLRDMGDASFRKKSF